MLRTDGVGIRSALAAKRLNDLGMQGVAVPPELQVGLSACVFIHEWMRHGCAEASGPGRAGRARRGRVFDHVAGQGGRVAYWLERGLPRLLSV